ncbi:MAG: hypothetical protein EOO11_20390 [Chitinophagaceae bacterium]|nr:MAG: hypothetical protein EOO11_20390 [Chitinophagaceae bacterium]
MHDHLRYKTLLPRFGALIVDGVLFLLFSGLLDLLALWLPGSASNSLMNAGAYIVFTLYHIIAHGRYGMTVGKWVAKVQVCSIDGPETGGIGYAKAARREFLPFMCWLLDLDLLQSVSGFFAVVGWIGWVLWLGDIVAAFFDTRNRALHDQFADTVVVNLRYPPVPQEFDFEAPQP